MSNINHLLKDEGEQLREELKRVCLGHAHHVVVSVLQEVLFEIQFEQRAWHESLQGLTPAERIKRIAERVIQQQQRKQEK